MRPDGYDYDTHSRIAGPLTEPAPDYRVEYRRLLAAEPHRIRAVLLMTLAPLLTGTLMVYLVWPSTGPSGTAGRPGWWCSTGRC